MCGRVSTETVTNHYINSGEREFCPKNVRARASAYATWTIPHSSYYLLQISLSAKLIFRRLLRPPGGQPCSQFGGGAMRKILLVEDNEMNRDMLSRRLVRSGYEVIMAEDGARGVAMATSDRPDLILMDMSLPVIDGWEATRRIKATPELRKIPIIALTAHAMLTDRDKALEAGCDDYDTKPIELQRLLGKMETLLAPAGE